MHAYTNTHKHVEEKSQCQLSLFMSRTFDLYRLNELLYGVEWKKDLQDAEDVITFHVCKRNVIQARRFS